MPQDMDDNTEDLQSSEQVDDVTDTSTEQVEAGAAEPSTATDEPKDMLSVVRDVVSKPDETASSAEEAEEETEEASQSKAEEPDDTNYSDVPFNKHPRFVQLLQKAKANEADASRYRNIEGFLQQNHLSSEEAADGLQIMALAKTNPAAALERLKPFVESLLDASGMRLPPDLKTQVQTGKMTREAALEVSRARATVKQTETARQRDYVAQQHQAQQQHAQTLANTANAWVQDRKRKDPAFQSKYDLLLREVTYLQRSEGMPNTPEGVEAQLKKAYDAVSKSMRTAAPAPAREARRPVTGGSATGNVAPAPKSFLDVVKATVAKQQ